MKPQIPQYISNISLNQSPFRFSENYNVDEAGEANTYNNIYAEGVYLNGSDIVYVERTVNNAEPIFGEYLGSVLETGTPMRLFNDEMSNAGAWGGGGDLYAKFGLQIQDETTWYCPTLTFAQAKINPDYNPDVDNSSQFLPFAPKVGDLIFYVNGKKLYEIQHIENEAAPGMYIFGNRNSYQIKCKMYSYDHSEINVMDDSLPDEIKALDSVQTIDGKLFDILSNENNTFNVPIKNNASTVIDNSEIDPIG